MITRRISMLLLGLLFMFTFAACSDDDGGGTTPAGDTTAPLVVSADPESDDINVSVDEDITIAFNEAMDPSTATGNVTLSSGTISDLAWIDTQTLSIGHSDWAEGTEITVTIGTGVTDAAGNGLEAVFSVSFWTTTSAVTLLSTVPEDGATDVLRNAQVQMLFSRDMNLVTLDAAISANSIVPGKAVLDFSIDGGGNNWVILTFDETLPPSTDIDITIATSATDMGGANLDAEANFGFTTGVDTDTTPPTLVSIDPANGSTFSPNQGFIRMTFSESINPDTLDPTMFGAQFYLVIDLLGVEPVWTENNTVLTVALPTPLDPGFPIAIEFDPFADLAGNFSVAGIEYRATAAGTADFYPLIDDMKYFYREMWENGDGSGVLDSGTAEDWVQTEFQSGNLWFRTFYQTGAFIEPNGWDVYRSMAGGIDFTGFHEIDGLDEFDVTFTPVIPYVKTPWMAQSWNGTIVAVEPDGNLDVEYTMTVLVQEDIPVEDPAPLKSAVRPDSFWAKALQNEGTQFFWIDTWKQRLDFELSVEGVTETMGYEELWFAPTVGIVKSISYEERPDGTWEEELQRLTDFGLELNQF